MNMPNEPDGIFHAAAEAALLRAAHQGGVARSSNIPVIPSRLSILTQPLNGRAGLPLLRPVRPRLRHPLELLLAVGAAAAGDEDRKLTIITGAMAREVTVDARPGWPTGVTYIDKKTQRDNHVRARIVVLAASACESARILLNSKSSKFPAGAGQLERRRSAAT